jgi:sphingolipid delta-4 desaturase
MDGHWIHWWLGLLIAYCIGAFANHANYVIIHDATHNLILRSKAGTKSWPASPDLPNLTPGAMGFRVYHLKHHSHRGAITIDADLANHWEARLVGNKCYRKTIWLTLFPFLIDPAAREKRSKCGIGGSSSISHARRHMMQRCLFLRLAGISLSHVRVFSSIGLPSWPVGFRTLHLRFRPETFSYYGPINRVALNMGYQQAPRSAFNSMEQSPEAAGDGAGICDNLSITHRGRCSSSSFSTSVTLYSRIERMKQRVSARRFRRNNRSNERR